MVAALETDGRGEVGALVLSSLRMVLADSGLGHAPIQRSLWNLPCQRESSPLSVDSTIGSGRALKSTRPVMDSCCFMSCPNWMTSGWSLPNSMANFPRDESQRHPPVTVADASRWVMLQPSLFRSVCSGHSKVRGDPLLSLANYTSGHFTEAGLVSPSTISDGTLRRVVSRFRNSCGIGLDQWRSLELNFLPVAEMQGLAGRIRTIDLTLPVPVQCLANLIVFLPKPVGFDLHS